MHNILAVVKRAETVEIQRKSRNLNGLRDSLFLAEKEGFEPSFKPPNRLKINGFKWFTFLSLRF
jgi:hypothetical protein